MAFKLYWHVHHDELAELSECIGERRAFIKRNKHRTEVPVRLRLLKVVKHPPKVIQKAIDIHNATNRRSWQMERKMAKLVKYSDYWKKWDKCAEDLRWAESVAYDRMYILVNLSASQLKRLHKKECKNCPWNGETIFPPDKRSD